jgi:glycosyltransferase involved in cell wall biosynthesis
MRVAIDARKRFERSGTGIISLNLLRTLSNDFGRNQYIIFGDSSFKGCKARRTISAIMYELVWKQVFLPFDLRLKKVDVSLHTYPIVPVLSSTPAVSIIYDMQAHSEPSEKSWSNRIMLASLRICAKRSRIIITLSEFAKSEIVRFLRVKPERVIVAYPGCDHLKEQDNSCKLPDGLSRYILTVLGSFAPRKNATTLLRAYGSLPEKVRKEYKLVIVGKKSGKDWKAFAEELERSGLKERIAIIHASSDRLLTSLYVNADLLVHITLYEGFGLPVAEAMSLGVPVIASNRGAIREVAGNCALIGDPNDSNWVSTAILTIIENNELREDLVAKARERANAFKWVKMAQTVENALEAAVA